MTLIEEYETIKTKLIEFEEQEKKTVEEEAYINAQIAALRMEIATLRSKRSEIKTRIRNYQSDKESLERKIELEKQAAEIESNLEEKRARVLELIKDAPWFDTAFPWQIDGAIRLPERALLADKRGMGKTLSAIIWRRAQESKRTLICVRREVAYDFMKELHLREPGLFVYPLIGANSESRNIAAMLLKPQKEFVVITNIESWRRNIDQTTEDILRLDYDAVILDEAHHIKNAGTGTAKGFFKLAEKIPKVLELTGTPIKNRPQEMFSLLHALYPDLFPRETKYLTDYCVQTSQNRWAFTSTGLKSLIAKISSFYIARSPEDIGRKLPPPNIIEYKLTFEAHEQQKAAYQAMTERSLAVLNSGKVVPIVSQLAIMTRQAQMVSWPAGIELKIRDPDDYETILEVVRFDIHESVKMDWAEDFIKELHEEERRVVLFSRFKPAIYELRNRLIAAGLSVAVITGDEKAKNNTEDIFDDFDLKTAPENPKYDVLLATYQTVGESANLNAANDMILYDRFWNPGNEDQAIGRIDRINSVTQATIHIPYVENTIDEYMAELINEKRTIVNDFKDTAAQQSRLTKHLEKTI